jgi:hypothetical protein
VLENDLMEKPFTRIGFANRESSVLYPDSARTRNSLLRISFAAVLVIA